MCKTTIAQSLTIRKLLLQDMSIISVFLYAVKAQRCLNEHFDNKSKSPDPHVYVSLLSTCVMTHIDLTGSSENIIYISSESLVPSAPAVLQLWSPLCHYLVTYYNI